MRDMHTDRPANRLRELRLAAGYKIHQVSSIVGRGDTVIVRYENGRTGIPDDAKLKLADHFGVSVEYLMGWDRIDDEVAAAS